MFQKNLNSEVSMTDSELMKDTRTRLGLTQSEMAALVGYGNQKDISNIERGIKEMSNPARAHVMTIRKYEIKD